MKSYQEENARIIDSWCEEGWEWGEPIPHEVFEKAKAGEWDVLLTPTKPVPHEWFGDLSGRRVLGLASGGGQQIPIFSALGADCTLLDYSEKQCESDRMVARREGYAVEILRADMTKPLPFPDESFDLIFHPVSNCYVEEIAPIFRECYRVLKKGGALLGGYDIGINYLFDEEETTVTNSLPFNPLKDPALYEKSMQYDWGIQFSHTVEEQLRSQLRAGFALADLYEDTNGSGRLHELGVPCFLAVRAVKV
ncbi:MAG: class I SAM-dependent methyltransferase [Ruminococcaceae bacterium]|nr:class I SAM-dependent methyltransferase [Oscillospiraceae bacterium]